MTEEATSEGRGYGAMLVLRAIKASVKLAEKRLLEAQEHPDRRRLCLVEAEQARAEARRLQGILQVIEERAG